MNTHTIQQLNQINKTFYEKVGPTFSDTRQQPWEGWTQLLPYLKQLPDNARILDVGCGNARFAQFLDKNVRQKIHEYIGIDGDEYLIHEAEKLNTNFLMNLHHIDILTNIEKLYSEKFDCIVMFGVLHHIPSFEKRQEVLQHLFQLLQPNGILIVSAWQFLTIPNLKERIIDWSRLPSIDSSQLEDNDFLLDWQRETTAIRYCHQVDREEFEHLLQPLQYKKVDFFEADGKNKHTNLYGIIEKHA